MLNFETIHQLALESFSHNSKQVLTHWKKFNRNAMKQNADSSSSSSSLLSLSNGEGGGGKLIDTNDILSKLQSAIYPSLANYQDIFISMYSNNNREAVDNLLCLHVVNHILASNQIIQLNNKRIQDQEGENNEDSDDNDESREEWRDQGYTRPKVLVLLPTRGMAASFIEQMIQLLGDDDNNNTFYENLERFQEEYGTVKPDPDLNSNQVMESVDEANRRRKAVLNAKGKDWLELFGDESNSDDDFKIGISFSSSKPNNKQQRNGKKNSNSKKKGLCVKFFSEFYHCDLILASPLGLKMSQDGEEEESDFDFLSSVEVVLVHHSDVIYMQNWDHMNFLLDNINQQPKKSSGIDFSRVRKYLLDGEAANRRQLIFVSRFNDPHIQAAFNRKGTSIAGKLKVRKRYPDDQASICNVLTNVRQIFQRVPCDSFLTQGDCRLKYFREHILPQIIRTKQSHTLIFIPSYFEFVSLRNLLLKLEISFVSVTEYARGSEVSRGRARFLQGRKPIMLYTGRAHFFLRHHIKGAKHLIMFGLPEYADFYPGLLNMLADQPNLNDDALDSPMSSLGLFTSYDALSLERIVGSKRCERMLSGEKNMFLFKS
jgi:U3 small nucleolar RNA-associated protein 25